MKTIRIVLLGLILILVAFVSVDCAQAVDELFPKELPAVAWLEFPATGFTEPVAGMIFRTDRKPCCGVPLGGIGTGCLDIDTQGNFGFSAVFQRYPRQAKRFAPFLGLAVGDETWVLSSSEIIAGGVMEGTCSEQEMTDPYHPDINWARMVPKLKGVKAPQEVYYWGHYPVADIQYDTDSPVSVALRAWAPFVPGDAYASNIPGAVFEVQLKNISNAQQIGTVALSFPGPEQAETGTTQFDRQKVQKGDFTGLSVKGKKTEYSLGVIGQEKLRFGNDLNTSDSDWSGIAVKLPEAGAADAGTAVAVDFSLAPGDQRKVRFVLSWYVPHWGLDPQMQYHEMYAARYHSSAEVAADLSGKHESLLGRILAWQQAIYTSKELPVWLRETLVNNFALIPEASYWAQSKAPIEWAGDHGLYGMIESPRQCPQIECIPCSWYGNIPLVYFFPDLALSTLRGYKQYQAPNGAAPFCFGPREEMFAGGHAWQNQISLNSFCYVDMVDRMWLRTGDDAILREFYESSKKATTLTAITGEPPANIISMPSGERQTEWFEIWEVWPWTGMTSHAGGVRLANMALAKRMAEKMGDEAFTTQCQEWLAQGQKNMEELMWLDDTYMMMWNLNSGVRNDTIVAYQLDGEWTAVFHGLPGVFRADRVPIVLETIKRTCLIEGGVADFATRSTGKPIRDRLGISTQEATI